MILLAIPTMVEQIFSTLLQYVDTAMVGRLGEQATAAVSVTTTINWLIGSLASAVGVAGLAMISKAVGENDHKDVRVISSQLFMLVIGCATILGVAAMALSPFIPGWMGAEEAIQRNASLYFFIISVPMVFRVGNSIFGSALRATKDTFSPMLINLLANFMNIGLNYLFIYILNMGVIGAAVGSAISYVISGGLMFAAYRRNELLHFEWKGLHIVREKMKECAQIGVPVLLTSATSCFGYIVFAALVSGMGTTIFAAHSIAVTAETIFYIPGYGLRTATSTLVGNALGERNRKKFERVSAMSVALTIVMMIINGVLLYVSAPMIMNLMTGGKSEQVVNLGAQMLRLVAYTEPFFGLMIVMEGILYGMGRTKYAFVVETFSMWGIRIVFTAICVRMLKLDLQAVWFCMIADNIFKAIALTIPMCSRKYRVKLFQVEE